MPKFKLDLIDRSILGALMINSRLPVSEIARKCDVSGAAIHQRIRKMERAGIITGYRMMVDRKVLDLNVMSFITLKMGPSTKYADIVRHLQNIPEILECHFITGSHSIFIKVLCYSHEHLLDLMVNEIQSIPGVVDTKTSVSLFESMEHPILLDKLNDQRVRFVKSEEELTGKPPKVLKKRGRKPKNKNVEPAQ